MEKSLIVALTIVMAGAALGYGQVGGNIGYAQAGGKARAEQEERTKRVLTPQELPPSSTSMFVEASVLINAKPDEYVAVFGLSQEGDTVEECVRKMDARIKRFTDELERLGVG